MNDGASATDSLQRVVLVLLCFMGTAGNEEDCRQEDDYNVDGLDVHFGDFSVVEKART